MRSSKGKRVACLELQGYKKTKHTMNRESFSTLSRIGRNSLGKLSQGGSQKVILDEYPEDSKLIISLTTLKILEKSFKSCCTLEDKLCRPFDFVGKLGSDYELRNSLKRDNRFDTPNMNVVKLSKMFHASLITPSVYSARVDWNQVLKALRENCDVAEPVIPNKRPASKSLSWSDHIKDSKYLNSRNVYAEKLSSMFSNMGVDFAQSKRSRVEEESTQWSSFTSHLPQPLSSSTSSSTPSSKTDFMNGSFSTNSTAIGLASTQSLPQLYQTTQLIREKEQAERELSLAQEKLDGFIKIVKSKFKQAKITAGLCINHEHKDDDDVDFELSLSIMDEADNGIMDVEEFGSSNIMIADRASQVTSELRNEHEDISEEIHNAKEAYEAKLLEDNDNDDNQSPALRQLLQPFTDEEMSLTEASWSHGHESEHVVVSLPSGAGRSLVPILGQHMHRMREGWLVDETINGYMFLLQERDRALCQQDPERLPSHFFSSFFFSKMFENDKFSYSNVKRWGKKVAGGNIFKMSKVIAPINLNNSHWCSLCADFKKKTIQYYDSMSGPGMRYINGMKLYLAEEAKKFRGTVADDLLDMETWTLVPCRHRDEHGNIVTPQQDNCNDCGVFSCTICNLLSVDEELNFNASHMPTIRRRISMDLLNREITPPPASG